MSFTSSNTWSNNRTTTYVLEKQIPRYYTVYIYIHNESQESSKPLTILSPHNKFSTCVYMRYSIL